MDPTPQPRQRPWPLFLASLLLAACGGGGSPSPQVTGVSVEGPLHLVVGRWATLSATVSMEGAGDRSVNWDSNVPARLPVYQDGRVLGMEPGPVLVTATSVADPSVYASHVMNVVAEPWTDGQSLPTIIEAAAGAMADGVFYLVGGYGLPIGEPLVNHLSHAFAYDLGADAWTRLPDLPQPVVSGCAARLGNAIYLTGGWNQGGALDTVYRLDLSDRTWEGVDDPLPQPRSYHACTVVDGRLYLIGGAVGGDWLTQPSTWSYDPLAAAGERWTVDLAPPPGGGMEGSAVAVGDAIYFLGSYELADYPASRTSQPTVVRYDPVDDDWQALPDLQTARGAAGAWSDGRYLYVVGGGARVDDWWPTPLSSLEIYDLEQGLEGSWTYGDPLSEARYSFNAGFDPGTQSVVVASGRAADMLTEVELGRGLRPEP